MTSGRKRMKQSVLRYLKDKVLPPYRPTRLGKAIIDSMTEHPDDWKLCKHTADHVPSGISVWLANDVVNRRIYQAPEGINVESANRQLSYGDQVAIEEISQRLRRRTSEPQPVDPIVELLAKTTDKP
jgi:hypothetical protein